MGHMWSKHGKHVQYKIYLKLMSSPSRATRTSRSRHSPLLFPRSSRHTSSIFRVDAKLVLNFDDSDASLISDKSH